MEVPQQPAPPAAEATLSVQPASGLGFLFGGLALIPLFLLLAFHIGAGYLSYQKYGSGFYAFINFIFAYFYYPYYAFFLAKEPAPTPMMPAMIGGKSFRKLFKGLGIRV